MKKKSIRFVVFTILLSVFILSNGQPSQADDSDYETTPNADGTVTITKYTGLSETVTIPGELDGEIVTRIGEKAFEGGNLTSIKIPKSVTEIGTYAFWSVKSLRTVKFEVGSALQTIGNDAFRDTGLTTIKIPKSVTEIGSYAFDNVPSLSTVEFEAGSALQTIGNDAFRETGLTTIKIPKSVTEIGSYAFGGAKSLSTVEFEAGSALQTIGNNAFRSTGLTTIKIPKSVTEIGSYAFYNASSLSTVEFESGSELHTIGENAFAYTGLTSIRIPSSVVNMGKDIFSPKTTDFTIMSLLDKRAHKYATDYNHKYIPLYQLKYDGNGHTAGDVPEDKEEYLFADPITVLSHGNLVKDEFQFVGWNTVSDGSGEKVQAGEQPLYQDVGGTLYAQWSVNEHTITIDHVHAITDIRVPVSADTASSHLPLTVVVTLSDKTTQSIPVTWNGGTPVFDGNTPGDYEFTGSLTLPMDVTNPKNWPVKVKVIVRQVGTDTEAPRWPASSDLSLTDVTTTSIQLSWPLATDNIAVTGYRIYVDGVEKATVGNHEYSYVVTGLNAKTTYNFAVRAYDAAGNASFDLNALATTLSPPVYPDSGSGNSDSEPSYVLSSNADLQELKVLLNGQLLTLTPEGSAFTLKTEASEIELFPTTAHSAAKVSLNGNRLVKGQKMPLQEGTNTFELIIEAEKGTKKIYTVTIQRTSTEPVAPIVPVEPNPVEPDPVKPVNPIKPIEFNDTTGHWAEDYIQQAAALGILKGYPDGTFKPNEPLTRAQAVSIIVRALNLQADEAAPIKDIGNYADETQAEIAAAYQFGIIKGSNGDFKPSDKITRAQIALMIERAYAHKTGTKYDADKAPYSDFGNYDAETTNAISMLHELGLATGSNGKFNPSDPTTRAHAAKMLVNLLGSLK